MPKILFLVANDEEEEEEVGTGRMAVVDPASTGKWKDGPSGESRMVAKRRTTALLRLLLLRCHSDPEIPRLDPEEEEEEEDVVVDDAAVGMEAADERRKGSGDWLLRCHFLHPLLFRTFRKPDDIRKWMLLLLPPLRRRETVADVALVVVAAVRRRRRSRRVIGRQQRREQLGRRRPLWRDSP